MTRRVLTNVEKPEALAAPMGQFLNLREYPNASFKRVTAPNADTLYSSSFIDVSKEPFILQVPDEHGRYYLVPMYEAWTNIFADPGTRTTGTAAGIAEKMPTMSREGRAPRLVEPEEMVPPLLYVVSREADTVNGWRLDANHWDRSLSPAKAARRAGRPAGFEMHPQSS